MLSAFAQFELSFAEAFEGDPAFNDAEPAELEALTTVFTSASLGLFGAF